MKKKKRHGTISVPGQEWRSIGYDLDRPSDGCRGIGSTGRIRVDACPFSVPAQTGVLQPRCQHCFPLNNKLTRLINDGVVSQEVADAMTKDQLLALLA